MTDVVIAAYRRSPFHFAGKGDLAGVRPDDAGTLLAAYERMPASVLAPERKKRAYISSILARNEIDRDYAYNRHLFQRVATGVYQLNPALSLRRPGADGVDAWVPVFSALNLPLAKELADPLYDRNIDRLLGLAGLPPTSDPIIHRADRRRAEQ